MSINIVLLSWIGLILSANDTPVSSQIVDCYGNAVVSKVLRIDENCTLYSNIEGLPPIIGQNMPVKVHGLKTANNAEFNRKIQKFLAELLLTDTGKSGPEIILKKIQRGDTFCLCADVEVNGNDLCDLLVENGLAQRIIEIKEPHPQQNTTQPTSQTGVRNRQATITYIASRTSKIFHRAGCPHAKRIDPAKAVNFSTRDEAVKSGRKPCKTCHP